MERWPNLFIVGAPRAGTTSLHAYLNESPDIFMSPIKEPNYFSSKTIPDNSIQKPIRDKKKYLELFKNAKNEKYLGESSPSYLSDPEAPKLIHESSPQAKIIISLRDPVERVFSNFLMGRRLGITKLSFHEEIGIGLKEKNNLSFSYRRLVSGLYSSGVEKYLEIFGHHNVEIIIFEQFIININKTYEKLLKFLDLNYIKNFEKKMYNPYTVPRIPFASNLFTSTFIQKIIEKNILPLSTRKFLREKVLFKNQDKPTMNENDRKILVNYYQNDVKKLQKILGRTIPWPNFYDRV